MFNFNRKNGQLKVKTGDQKQRNVQAAHTAIIFSASNPVIELALICKLNLKVSLLVPTPYDI